MNLVIFAAKKSGFSRTHKFDVILKGQDLGKSQFLADLAVLSRAAYMQWSDTKSRNLVVHRSEGMGAAFGWGPENDYVSTLNKHGIWVHASDYNKNLAALSNVALLPPRVAENDLNRGKGVSAGKPQSGEKQFHTVAFLMTDGDNLQWTLGPWSIDARWYGSPHRGAVPFGWTLSPAMADISPASIAAILRARAENDEFISGPSGYGYIYPNTWLKSEETAFSQLTQKAMAKASMPVPNILGQNNDAPSPI